MSDVIDPSAIPIPPVRPADVDTAARALQTDGADIARLGHDIENDWHGLRQFYRSPEAETLFGKIHPVAVAGDGIEAPAKTAGDALITFAETAKTLVHDLNDLKTKATNFRNKIAGDDGWRKDEDKVNEHNQLNNDILAKLAAYQAAERDCANKITALFGGTHFIGADPTAKNHPPGKGEQVYGLSKPIKDIETPWAKPQKYDAPWYEDVWNGIKDFGVGTVQDLASLVGLYGDTGWGWQGWSGLGHNWENLAGGIAGLAGFYGPKGWGWQGWGTLGNNWLNLVNAFVPYREWDGGNGAGYVITQSILNIGSCFIGAGVVKGLTKTAEVSRAMHGVEGLSKAEKAAILGRAFTTGFKDAFKLPRITDLKNTLDNLKFKISDLRGIGHSLDEADNLHLPDTHLPHDTLPDTHLPDHEPAHIGGHHPGTDHDPGTGHGTDHGGSHDPGTDHTDPGTHHETGDTNTGRPGSNEGHANPSDGHSGHDSGTSDPETQRKLARAAKLEEGLKHGGLTQDQIDRLRGDLPPDSRQWQRLASALEQSFGKKIKNVLHPKAVQFAIDHGHTADPETFAHRYEYVKARFDALQDHVRDGVRNGSIKLGNKSIAQEAAERLNHLDLDAELKADIQSVHEVRPHPVTVDPHLPERDLENAVRSKAGGIDMGSDTSAAYHVRKHYDELPTGEDVGNPTQAYFDSAARTIHDGHVWKREMLPGGAERFIFHRAVVDTEGRTKLMEAIVIVRRDGKVVMATYGAAKAK